MSLINFRERLGARMKDEESGFSLVELLVVMLILGLLAAIAIPAFFNQRDKARDADAKSAVRTAQTAIETYAVDNDGSYENADIDDDLRRIEPTLEGADLTFEADPTDTTYHLRVLSGAGQTFDITRDGGITTFPCAEGGEGGCPTNEVWAGDPPEAP